MSAAFFGLTVQWCRSRIKFPRVLLFIIDNRICRIGRVRRLCRERIVMTTSSAVPVTVSDGRYYYLPNDAAPDPISGLRPKKLKYGVGGVWKESKTAKYMPCYDPSTGAVIAYAPQCTAAEVEEAISTAAKAFPAWRDTPVAKRIQVLFKMKQLLDEHLDELTYLLAQENGKKWDEAMGDVLKVIEVVEFACGAPQMMKGESLMNVSAGYDTVQFREPLGVFAGIAPWNFPAMIPAGLDGAHLHRRRKLHGAEGGQLRAAIGACASPSCGRKPACLAVCSTSSPPAATKRRFSSSTRPSSGVTFVGSTSVGLHVYATAAVQRQACTGADRSQEPRAGDERRGHRAHGAGHHQLFLRMRRRALHGAAGRGGRRTPSPTSWWKPSCEWRSRSTSARLTTRAPAWARW